LFRPGRNRVKVNTTGAQPKGFKASNITHTQRVRRPEQERDSRLVWKGWGGGKGREIEPVEASLPTELLPDKRTMDCSSHKSCTTDSRRLHV